MVVLFSVLSGGNMYVSPRGILEVCKWNLQINENGGLRRNHRASFPAVTIYLNKILGVYPIYIKMSYLRLRIKMTSSSYGRLEMFNVHPTQAYMVEIQCLSMHAHI